MQEITRLLLGNMPGQLVIQYTNACNATCPQCELRATNRFPRNTLPLDDVKRMIDTAAKNGVQAISFTGGEPLMFSDHIIELLHHCDKAGIHYARTGTNGFMFRNYEQPEWEHRIRSFAERLAGTGIYTFWISIDSADPAVHEEMRGLPGVVQGIERALSIFREYEIYPAANLGINRNVGGRWTECELSGVSRFVPEEFYKYFRRSFDRFYKFVTDLGFITANACYPMSVQEDLSGDLNNLYGASSSDDIVRFTPQERGVLFKALMDTIPERCSDIRIFTPLTSLYVLHRYYSDGIVTGYPCPGGINYFFVEAENGDTFPCGFRGNENLGKFQNIDPAELKGELFCRKCDWECFRDPAELAGPILESVRHPFKLFARFRSGHEYRTRWIRDMRYYRACRYFNCRVLPDWDKMRKFVRLPHKRVQSYEVPERVIQFGETTMAVME